MRFIQDRLLEKASNGQKQITLGGSQLNTYIKSNNHAFWHSENCTTDDNKHPIVFKNYKHYNIK
jgi:hypothetical protein